ncbi:MAG: LPS export ABC transporter ATP-binding protein [Elusimicrobiota bacterium]
MQQVKLKADNISMSYSGKKVVNNASIEVGKGEIVGLLGPNGAGKTTIFRMMVGLLHPDAGGIFLSDRNITKTPMFKRAQMGMSYLPQEPSIFRKLTVEQNLNAIAEFLTLPAEERKHRVESSLAEFGLTGLRGRRADLLSGGEKRRVEIARALLMDPAFLLLDEPFVGIDPITVSEIQDTIHVLKEKSIGILVTDHNVREMLEVIDRAYIIYDGKILLEGNAGELIQNPEARRVYLGEKFRVE